MIRVLLADDQATVRGALAALLKLEKDIDVVAEVSRADEVVSAAREKKPDVALLDIEMPGGDGLAAAAGLREALPSCRVLMLTTFGRPGYLKRAMEGGAVGFLTKDMPAAQLASAIRRVMAGERVIDPQLAIDALSEGDNPLTERERDVLAAASSGAGIAEIASQLFLSPGTVRNYLSLAIQKLDAANRFEAARLAREKGWI
ncbi:MAG TPA: response regulator transcription factor [Spirochaetia bacterium]|nr:response regulator transcription factor [Spirochaetia bacterium]